MLDDATTRRPANSPSRPLSRLPWQLVLALLLATVLRVHDIGRQSYWLDEFLSLQTSSGRSARALDWPQEEILTNLPRLTALTPESPWWAVWGGVSRDSHPPLYFLVLRLWRDLFGDTEAATRSLSLLASLASIALLYDVVRLLHGGTPAAWAAFVASVSPPQILFAQEARAYALLTTLLLGAADALLRLERRGASRRRAFALGALALCSALTHYYSLPLLVVLGVYALLRLRGAALRQASWALAVAGGLFLVAWGPHLRHQATQLDTRNEWNVEPREGHATRTAGRLASLPLDLLDSPAARVRSHRPAAAILYLAPLALLASGRREWLLWSLWLPASTVFVAGVDLARHSGQLPWIRYSLAATPALFALAGAAAQGAPRWLRPTPALAALAACLIALPTVYRSEEKPPWRGFADLVSIAVGRGERLVLYGASKSPEQILLGLTHYADLSGRVIVVTQRPLSGATLDRLRSAGTLWLATYDAVEPRAVVPGCSERERINYPGVGALIRMSCAG